jgi:hypothetical protein
VLIDTLAPQHEVAERIWHVVEERLLRENAAAETGATQ